MNMLQAIMLGIAIGVILGVLISLALYWIV